MAGLAQADCGAGAAARKSTGVTVFSGILASILLAVTFVPVFFLLIGTLQEWLAKKKGAAH